MRFGIRVSYRVPCLVGRQNERPDQAVRLAHHNPRTLAGRFVARYGIDRDAAFSTGSSTLRGHISSLGDVERSRFRRCRSNGRPQKKSPAGIRRGSHLVTETNRETCDRLLSRCRCLYTRSITACQVDVIAPVDKVETSRGTVSARLRRGSRRRAWKETQKRLSGRWRGDIVPTRRASFDSDPREKST